MDNRLKNMFKKEPVNEPATTEGAATHPPVRKTTFGVKSRPTASTDESESVSPAATAAETATADATPANDAPRPAGKLAGMFGTGNRAAASGGTQQPKPTATKLASSSVGSSNRDSGSDAVVVAPDSIDSLADLAAIDVSEAVEQRYDDNENLEAKLSHFDDEFPASKPVRELPEDLSKQGLAFVEMLDGIYDVVHDSELLGGMLKNVMMEFQENPQFESLIAKDDLRAFVVAARKTSGLARIKKTEAKAKRGTGAGSKSKSKNLDEDMLADLKMLEGLS